MGKSQRKSRRHWLYVLVSVVLTLAISLSYAAVLWQDVEKPVGPDNSGTPSVTVKVESIELDANGAKTDFAWGETFTAEGLKVTAKMSDGTKKEVSPEDYKIIAPDMEKSGERSVSVVYEGKTARYQISIAKRVLPSISTKPLLNVALENNGKAYRVEAENIDMGATNVQKPEGVTGFVGEATEESGITSGNKYLTGFGVRRNYFGFTVTTDQVYEGVTLVLRVANGKEGSLSLGNALNLYVNHTLTDTEELGKIDLSGYNVEGGVWKDIVIRNVALKAGENKIAIEAMSSDVANVDYIDFYVGTRYINSLVEITEKTTVRKDLEAFDTEKAFTRADVAAAHGLKDGQLFVEEVSNESPGKTTHGASSVGAIGNGSEVSTTLRLAQDATVKINFIGSCVGKGAYYVKENWDFSIDGYGLKLVEHTNIEGGDTAANQWWDWIPTGLGVYNLPAGDHFFFAQVNGSDCNVDTIDFEIISYGSYDESGMTLEEQANLHECESKCHVCGGCKDDECDQPACENKCICTAGVLTTKGLTVEAEAFDHDFVVSRPDFVTAGRMPDGQYFTEGATGASGGKAICGFTAGTKFVVKFNATIDMKAKIELVGATDADYPVAEKMKFSVDGVEVSGVAGSLTGSEQPVYWDWQRIDLGEFTLTAGLHTLTIEIVDGHPNLDCLVFTPTEYDEGAMQYDATLSATKEVKIEAETFSKENVVTRKDFVDAGVLQAGDYKAENDDKASNGKRIYGLGDGTNFTWSVKVVEAKKYTITLSSYAVALEKLSVTVDGDACTELTQKTEGDWTFTEFGTFEFAAGDHTVSLTFLEGNGNVPDLDYVAFTPVGEAHEHTYENACDTTCNGCGEVREITHAPNEDDGDCTTAITCSVCGAELTASKEHAFDNACDTTCNNEGCTHERTITHAFSDTYLKENADADKHYHVCAVCGVKDEGEAHTPNAEAATEETDKYCTVCDYVIEQYNHTHAFVETVADKWKKSDASCTAKAVYYKSCECGAVSEETFEAGELLEHTYDNACDGICNVCNQETREPAAHVPNEDDGNCTTAITCSICGEVTTEAAAEHTYDNACDASCNVCGTERTPSEHVYDGASDADCNVCDATRVVSVTEINEATTIVKDLENFNAMNATTRSDIVNAYGLKPGQLFVENVTKESPGKTTSGGKSVGALVGGSVSTVLKLEKDATVKLGFVAAATDSYIVANNWKFTIDGVQLVMVEQKDIQGGNPGAGEYWDWFTTDLGVYNLPAGEREFVLEVHGGSCNIDCVNFEVLSYGSYDASGYALDEQVKIDAQLSATEKTVIGLHTLDKAGVVTREDFIPAVGEGNYGSMGDESAYCGTRIYGLGGGTSFTANVYVGVAGEYTVALRSYALDISVITVTVNGTAVSLTQEADTGSWVNNTSEVLTLVQGMYTVKVSFTSVTDLDCLFFLPVTEDGGEGEIVYDATLSTAGTTTIEAETFSKENVVTRKDFIDAGILTAGDYKVTSSSASGGKHIYGLGDGTKFTWNVDVKEAGKYTVALRSYSVPTEKLKVTIDDVVCGEFSQAADGESWILTDFGTFDWSQGGHTVSIEFLAGNGNVPDLDCVVFAPVVVYDAAISMAGATTVEAETFSNESVVSRSDFVEAGRMNDGEYFTEGATGASGGKAICGFITGTKFTVTVNVTEAGKYTVALVGATDATYPISEKMKISVDGTEITGIEGSLTGTEEPTYWDWQTITVGMFDWTAGAHTVVIEIVDGQPNLDCLVFIPVAA